jgi:hypothetical protein
MLAIMPSARRSAPPQHPVSQATPSTIAPLQVDAAIACDLFCAVIDNFGDIGVCWRLARQLTSEHGWRCAFSSTICTRSRNSAPRSPSTAAARP